MPSSKEIADTILPWYRDSFIGDRTKIKKYDTINVKFAINVWEEGGLLRCTSWGVVYPTHKSSLGMYEQVFLYSRREAIKTPTLNLYQANELFSLGYSNSDLIVMKMQNPDLYNLKVKSFFGDRSEGINEGIKSIFKTCSEASKTIPLDKLVKMNTWEEMVNYAE